MCMWQHKIFINLHKDDIQTQDDDSWFFSLLYFLLWQDATAATFLALAFHYVCLDFISVQPKVIRQNTWQDRTVLSRVIGLEAVLGNVRVLLKEKDDKNAMQAERITCQILAQSILVKMNWAKMERRRGGEAVRPRGGGGRCWVEGGRPLVPHYCCAGL